MVRAGLGSLPLTAPALLVVGEGEFTASNYPGPLVMTLCPLQFPWDTLPLLPSSPEPQGARLASQNRFFSGTKKIRVETMLAQLARAGSWQGEHCESSDKEELCISLTAFLLCEGTQRKFFISAKTYFPVKGPLSSGSSPSRPPPLPSRPETSECHFHAVRPPSGSAEPAAILRDPSCCAPCPSGWDAAPGQSSDWGKGSYSCMVGWPSKVLINNCKFTGGVLLAPRVPSQIIFLHTAQHKFSEILYY